VPKPVARQFVGRVGGQLGQHIGDLPMGGVDIGGRRAGVPFPV
jgi:hypothetical protein